MFSAGIQHPVRDAHLPAIFRQTLVTLTHLTSSRVAFHHPHGADSESLTEVVAVVVKLIRTPFFTKCPLKSRCRFSFAFRDGAKQTSLPTAFCISRHVVALLAPAASGAAHWHIRNACPWTLLDHHGETLCLVGGLANVQEAIGIEIVFDPLALQGAIR